MGSYNEDELVQKTTAAYLSDCLGWDSVYAFNTETFGVNGTLGRVSDKEIVLTRYLRTKLVELNPNLPEEAYDDAVKQVVTTVAAQSLLATNQDKYDLLKNGVYVTFKNQKGDRVKEKLLVIDFDNPGNNHFLCVRELWIRGDLYRRRTDIVGFVNGLPLIFMELKNLHKSVREAYEKNFKDYLDTVPHLFEHNCIVVIANGVDAKLGSLTSRYEHFYEWKRLEEDQPGVVEMETLLRGICEKDNLIDFIENFIIFDNASGTTKKILARNHQFLGVNRAFLAVKSKDSKQGKLGVFWHTQGAGKSYSIVMFTRKIHRKLGGNFTFVILTDREDLDTQLYKTFAGCGVVNNDRDPCRASDGEHLRILLSEHKNYIFSLIQKFNQDNQGYTQREDIIVITDEAHRTQYGTLALNLRNALPNASFIGFTGTPLFKDDEITRKVFGEYISTYDFQRAVEDKATVPLYYDARGQKLGIALGDINDRIAEKIEDIDDIDVQQRLEKELRRDYHVVTANSRLEEIAKDLVQHYSTAWESGKAILVCIDKITCVKMYNKIDHYWKEKISDLELKLPVIKDSERLAYCTKQILWMKETKFAVVISEEQGEVEKFRRWDLDIIPHRRLMKEGFELPEPMRKLPQFKNLQRLDMDEAFKEEVHPFRLSIVCAMWLTGFDVPSLSTLYLDKPLKAHTLMQAIARANRVSKGKNNGLIVDYCGILKSLRKALATFAGFGDSGHGKNKDNANPAKPDEELLQDLLEAIELLQNFLLKQGFSIEQIFDKQGFERNAALRAAKEAVNENDETRKHFEIMCREVFKMFKACINIDGINRFRHQYEAINLIYKSLQSDRELADITDIIQDLHDVIDQSVMSGKPQSDIKNQVYDISKIDFERLRKEFSKNTTKRTVVQNLRQKIENRLQQLLAQNPLRTDFQKHFEEIVHDYNREKDRQTIEQTFDLLIQFVKEMDKEDNRAFREGLDEETLALYDLLRKPELAQEEIKRIKIVAVELLETLKSEKLKIDHWREKESTRDAVRLAIRDFLWSDATGLPIQSYTEEEVAAKADDVFQHIYRAYPTLPSPLYSPSAQL